jgi:hypothetical protein
MWDVLYNNIRILLRLNIILIPKIVIELSDTSIAIRTLKLETKTFDRIWSRSLEILNVSSNQTRFESWTSGELLLFL